MSEERREKVAGEQGPVRGAARQLEQERLLESERAARAETEKARQEARAILESMSDAFFALDQERRFVYVNRQAKRFWDKRREELLGKNIWEVFPQAVGTESYQVIERAANEGVSIEFETISPVFQGSLITGRTHPSAEGLSVYFQDVSK